MKTVTTPTLFRLNNKAPRKGYNRTLRLPLDRLDPDGLHMLSQPFVHGDVQCVRATVCLLKLAGSDQPHEAVLDFDLDDWERLPEHRPSGEDAEPTGGAQP